MPLRLTFCLLLHPLQKPSEEQKRKKITESREKKFLFSVLQVGNKQQGATTDVSPSFWEEGGDKQVLQATPK